MKETQADKIRKLDYGDIEPCQTYVFYEEKRGSNYIVFGYDMAQAINYEKLQNLINEICSITGFESKELYIHEHCNPGGPLKQHRACLLIYKISKDKEVPIEGSTIINESVWQTKANAA